MLQGSFSLNNSCRRILNNVPRDKTCIVEDLLCVLISDIERKKRERERKIARKGSPPSGSSQSGWKKMRFKEIKVVRLFLRPGVGGGDRNSSGTDVTLGEFAV